MIRHVLLWASLLLSTVLTSTFLYSLGEDLVAGLVLAFVGVTFEAIKAYSWSRVGSRSIFYLWLAMPCTLLSLTASAGFASLTLERGWALSDRALVTAEITSSDRDTLDREERELLDAIDALPPGWTSSLLRLSERLDFVRSAKSRVADSVSAVPPAGTTAALSNSLARRLGFDGFWVVAVVLFCIATLLEVGIVVLALDHEMPRHVRARTSASSDLDRFLSVAVGPGGRLLGRRRLVELGWSEKEIREHVTTLLRSGVLTHQGRGSPIRLAADQLQSRSSEGAVHGR